MYSMLNSVRIGEKDLYTDFGCILMHVEIGTPSVKTKYVDVPLRDGKLDFTELLTGNVRYSNRPIKIDLKYIGTNLLMVQSDISNYLHGKQFNINFDEDASYFYVGRLALDGYEVKNYGGIIHLSADCDPFKYALNSSLDDWLWDSFDFEEGYINEFSNIPVNVSKTIMIIADKKGYAKVTSNAQFNVTYKDTTVTIGVGTTTLYDFEFEEGENTLTFQGTGTISIDYRGGRL